MKLFFIAIIWILCVCTALAQANISRISSDDEIFLAKLNKTLALANPIEFKFLPESQNYLAFVEGTLRPLATKNHELFAKINFLVAEKIEKMQKLEAGDLGVTSAFEDFFKAWEKAPIQCSSFVHGKARPFSDPEIWHLIRVRILKNPLQIARTVKIYENLLNCDLPSISEYVVLHQVQSLSELLQYMDHMKMLSAAQKKPILELKKFVSELDVYKINRQAFLREEFLIIKNLYDLTETQRIKPERKIWMNTIFEIPNLGEPSGSDVQKTISTEQIEASVVKGFWKEFLTLVTVNENLEIGSEEELLHWLTENIRNLPPRPFASSKEIREAIMATRLKIFEGLSLRFELHGEFHTTSLGWGKDYADGDLLKINKAMVESPRTLKERKSHINGGPPMYGLIIATLISDYRESRPQEFDTDFNYLIYKIQSRLQKIKYF